MNNITKDDIVLSIILILLVYFVMVVTTFAWNNPKANWLQPLIHIRSAMTFQKMEQFQ